MSTTDRDIFELGSNYDERQNTEILKKIIMIEKKFKADRDNRNKFEKNNDREILIYL